MIDGQHRYMAACSPAVILLRLYSHWRRRNNINFCRRRWAQEWADHLWVSAEAGLLFTKLSAGLSSLATDLAWASVEPVGGVRGALAHAAPFWAWSGEFSGNVASTLGSDDVSTPEQHLKQLETDSLQKLVVRTWHHLPNKSHGNAQSFQIRYQQSWNSHVCLDHILPELIGSATPAGNLGYITA